MKICLDEIEQNSPAINQAELPGNVVSPKVMQWLENAPETHPPPSSDCCSFR